MKSIDFSQTVWQLSNEYPEFIPIMNDLGFKEITNTVSLKTVGRFMTIPKGSAMKNIPMDTIIKKFEEQGFTVLNP